jgi:16S rRNA (adenine1518-N6/adenine1519-N6)-dimethyltransferase
VACLLEDARSALILVPKVSPPRRVGSPARRRRVGSSAGDGLGRAWSRRADGGEPHRGTGADRGGPATGYGRPARTEVSAIADFLTPRQVRRLLDEHGLAPRRSAGQNFVTDPNTVRRIVAAAGLSDDDVVLEIGPGLGSLTLPLAEAAAHVIAVEIDAGLVAALQDVLAGHDNVEVVHADALRLDLDGLLADRTARLVANLPYNTATPLVFRTLACSSVVDAFVMVQREVGQRWAARPGDPLHSGVSLKLRLLVDVEVALTIPRAVFHPVPNVDSVMVRLTRRPDAPDPATYARLAALVDTAFAKRRKTLRNTLAGIAPAARLQAAAAAARVDLGARAETLSTADVRRLDAALQRLTS